MRISIDMPVTRSSKRMKYDLKAGEHKVQFRLNQSSGPWQGIVFFRTDKNQMSGIEGVEWLENTKDTGKKEAEDEKLNSLEKKK